MTITREQVADLRPGDVVELTHASHEGVTLRGPARTHRDSRAVWVGDTLLMDLRGELRDASRWTHLTVVSRAPRPLYVNHPRTEPTHGDTAAWVGDQSGRVYWRADGFWLCNDGGRYDADQMPARLRLLVDGETGRCVQ
jgi:hypothetical protein